jgi:hypothetical protein
MILIISKDSVVAADAIVNIDILPYEIWGSVFAKKK